MSTDPNWFYSTIAQSSATIVAIIGGFITHSVLSLTAERRSLRNQRRDKEARLQALKKERDRLSEERDVKEVEMFIESIMDEMLDSGRAPSLEEIIRENAEAQTLNPNILRRQYELFAEKVIKAGDFITEHLQAITSDRVAFLDWIRANGLDVSQYDCGILERLYDLVQSRKLEQKQASLPSWEQDTASPMRLGWRLPHIPAASDRQELQRLRQHIQEYAGEVAALEDDVNDLALRISKFSYPPNLGWSVAPLAFLAVFCIFLPALIIADEVSFTRAKPLTLAAFGVGLVAVFTYILLMIRSLKREQ